MTRIKCVISYDGTGFQGYQVQIQERTVQSEIEKILTKMHNSPIRIHASGRTDAGVHAIGQVIHFDTHLQIEEEAWRRALNAQLPDDIYVHEVKKVHNDFHARLHARKKEYRYKLVNEQEPNIFQRNYVYHYPYKLELNRIEKAIPYLLGEKDFTSFCSAKTEVEDKVRTIYHIEIFKENNELTFQFVGNGFLYNMVRILVGTLLEIGNGKKKPEDLEKILIGKNRQLAGKTAPAQGLYLWRVDYDN